MHTPWNSTPGADDPHTGDPARPGADPLRGHDEPDPWRATRALDTCCTIRPVDGELLRWAWGQRERRV